MSDGARFEAAWHALAEARALPQREVDGDGCVLLPLANGLDAMLSLMPEDDSFVLYAELGVPTAEITKVQRELLEAMHLWGGSGGVTFGLLPGTDIVSAALLIPLREDLDTASLGEVIDHFADVTTTWLERLHAHPEELLQSEETTVADLRATPATQFLRP